MVTSLFEPLSNVPFATHLSEELDNEEWYKAILDLFYVTVAA